MDKFKQEMRFQLDPAQLLSFRKILWERGLQPQQFFAYVVHLVNLYDERLEPFYQEAIKDKLLKAEERKEEKIDPDTLYKLIENGLNDKKNE